MELCLGTVQFGMRYGIQGNAQPSQREVFEIITYALEHSAANWFDTAAAYGAAEELLGRYIQYNPALAEKMNIVSKLEPDALTNVPKEKRKEIVLTKIQESLKRLHRQQLDVYIFHNASYIFDEDAVAALDSVRQEGLAKLIGVSVYTPQEAMQALAYPQIKVIQIPYNVFDHRLDQCGFFEKAKKRQIHIFARSSLLQGLAVMRPEYLSEHIKFAVPYLATFHKICEDAAISPLHAAISFVAHHPGIDYLLFGVDNRNQLIEYISFASKPLPDGVVDDLNNIFNAVPEKLVNPSLWN